MSSSHLRAGPRARLRILIMLLLVGAGIWAGIAYLRNNRENADVLSASGTIETTQVSAASKVPGRIRQLHADEGDVVRAGQTLVTIEGAELAAQLDQARAALEAARARRQQAEAALALQRRLLEAQTAQAEAALDAARTRRQQAQEVRDLTVAQTRSSLRQAEAALATARANAAAARVALDRADRDLIRLEALLKEGAVSAQQVDAARAARDTARAQHEAAVKTAQQAEATVRLARANLQQVEIRERDVAVAEAQVRQAQAGVRNARAGEELLAQRRADVAAAVAQVAQAEAGIRMLRTQQQNLIIISPLDGVVVTKHASAGEIVAAGAPILTVADLDDVWVRLFIPLPRLGEVALGQRVEVTTDAFPDRVFTGTVTEIAQQAEFTPRNVQTQEERVKLVFAVKITLPNPDHALKPGMPADARIRAAGNRETTQRSK